jgi:hypothetical protein
MAERTQFRVSGFGIAIFAIRLARDSSAIADPK